jgi:hypothetical protein
MAAEEVKRHEHGDDNAGEQQQDAEHQRESP